MSTVFDLISIALFGVLVITYFTVAKQSKKVLYHFLGAGILFAIANQVGNAGHGAIAVALLAAGAAYAAYVFRAFGRGD